MKINALKNINNFTFAQNFTKNEAKTSIQNSVDEFSSNYSYATKSLASPQIIQKTFEEKQEELIDELVRKGVFKTRTDAGYFVYYRVSKDNYNLAKTIFDYEHIPVKTAIGIVKKTHKENEPLAQEMVKDVEFPPEQIEEILMSTHSGNIKSAFAAIKNKDISKETIPIKLREIDAPKDTAASLILSDENTTAYTRTTSLMGLNAINAGLVEKAYNLFKHPNPLAIVALVQSLDLRKVEFQERMLDLLSTDKSDDRCDLTIALESLREYNENEIREIFQELIQDEAIPRIQIAKILSSETKDNHHGRKKVFKALKDDSRISKNDLMAVVYNINNKSANLKVSIYNRLKENPDFPMEYMGYTLAQFYPTSNDEFGESVLPDNFIQGAKNFKEVHKILLKNPELYINGEADSIEEAQEEIEGFIIENFLELCAMSAFLDKEAMEILFRGRLENVEEYIDRYEALSKESLDLSNVFNSKDKEGKKLSSKDQIELFDLLCATKAINMSFQPLNDMVAQGKVDIKDLENKLLMTLLFASGLSSLQLKKISSEKLQAWDLKYIPYLAQEIHEMHEEENETLDKIVCAVCTEDNFKSFIHDDDDFGYVNELTQKRFKKLGLNYKAWLAPSKRSEVQFKYVDSNQEKLSQIIAQIEEDIEALRQTPAKGFIDKHFSDCIIGEKFKINEKYSKNKQTLEKFIKNMFELLDNNIFKRAQGNLNNPSKKQNAQMTLTIKSHLEQRLEDIKIVDKIKKQKPLDLTIKMWDRNPIHDLFQGNYSTCCIGLTKENSSAMPDYLGHSAFNMIELVDNNTGQTIGNALCYFAQDKKKKPVFVIDNIEIANKVRPSSEGGLKLRSAILEYARNVIKEVSNKKIPVLLGTSYNDVPDNDLKEYSGNLKIIGEFNCNQIYVDAFGGWVCPEDLADGNDEFGLKILN